MKYQNSTSIMIKGAKTREDVHYNFNILLNNKKVQIIKGTVFNQKQEPSKGAAIQVTQISNINNRRSILGYSYTDENGKYLFTIRALPRMRYEIAVYAPLT